MTRGNDELTYNASSTSSPAERAQPTTERNIDVATEVAEATTTSEHVAARKELFKDHEQECLDEKADEGKTRIVSQQTQPQSLSNSKVFPFN